MQKNNRKIKTPPVLFDQTQQLINRIEKKLEGDFLVYWVSSTASMSDNDVYAIHKTINGRIKHERLNLFIKSDGGSGKTALRIINLLRHHYKEIQAFIPLDCASAATMLALGADRIKMSPIAYLSAIDTSITHDLSPIDDKFNDLVSVSQNELDRVLRLWEENKQSVDHNPYNELYKYIHPLVFGAVDRASSLSIKLTTEILSYHMPDKELTDYISNHLNSDYPSHSYPITLKKAREISLPVEELEEDIYLDLLELNELYSEMAQKAHTDFDELNYHDNEILRIMERDGLQIYYQKDKNWHYLKEERRYISTNDESSWRKMVMEGGKVVETKFYIS